MDSVYFIVAEYVNAAADGKLNIMGTFDHIKAQDFPLTYPELFLVSRLIAANEEYGQSFKLQVKLVTSDTGEVLGELSLADGIVPSSETLLKTSITTFIKLNGITFPQPGMYEFHLYVDDKLKQIAPILVTQ